MVAVREYGRIGSSIPDIVEQLPLSLHDPFFSSKSFQMRSTDVGNDRCVGLCNFGE